MNRASVAAGMSAASFAVLWAGCLSQAPPLEVRYFEPRPQWDAAPGADGVERQPLRLDRVVAAPHLRQAMVWRVGAMEIAFDQRNHWAAAPGDLLSQALTEALFRDGGFRPSPRSDAPSLAIRLSAFEGDLTGAPQARIAMWADLYAETSRSRSFEVTESAAAADAESLAAAMARALQRLAVDVRQWCREP